MAFQEKLIDALGSFATTFNSYRYIQAIKSAFITLMPVIIVGAFSVLIGTSGSGKSTTLKMINRLVEHDSGTIRFAGEEIRSLPVLELRRRMGYAIQSIGLFPHWTVAQNIATVPQLEKWSRGKINERVDELMALLGLDASLRDRYPHQLSGGQQQRVAIARALALHPDILCFDEPTSALDPELTGEVLRVLRELAEHKTTMIIVTHEMKFARDAADRILFMDGGVVVEQGDAKELIDHPKEERTRQFLASYGK